MTMREKVEQELRVARRELESTKKQIDEAAETVKRQAAEDAFGMRPGLGCSHMAIVFAEAGTKYKAIQSTIDMLTYFLSEDPA